MVAAAAPEPRDVIWRNIAAARPPAGIRWAVRVGVLGLLVGWTVFAIASANVPDLLDRIDGSADLAIDGDSLAYSVLASTLPVALFLAVVNALPVVFKQLAKHAERAKAASRVELAVVRRFALFLLVALFAVDFTKVVIDDAERAFSSPVRLLTRVAVGTRRPGRKSNRVAARARGTVRGESPRRERAARARGVIGGSQKGRGDAAGSRIHQRHPGPKPRSISRKFSPSHAARRRSDYFECSPC